MMTLVRLTVVAVLVFILGGTAHAGVFGWIEKLSGPGPFGMVGEATPIWCHGLAQADVTRNELEISQGRAHPELSRISDVKLRDQLIHVTALNETRRQWFVTYNCRAAAQDSRYVVVGSDFLIMWTHQNQFAPPDDQLVLGLSAIPYVDVRLHRFVEIGAGFGFTRFSGQGLDTFWRPTYQPLRLTFRPLDGTKAPAFFRALLFRATVTGYGKFQASDFGSNPNGISYKNDGKLVWGVGVLLDVSRLLPAAKSKAAASPGKNP